LRLKSKEGGGLIKYQLCGLILSQGYLFICLKFNPRDSRVTELENRVIKFEGGLIREAVVGWLLPVGNRICAVTQPAPIRFLLATQTMREES
jgi:hypothetical protein